MGGRRHVRRAQPDRRSRRGLRPRRYPGAPLHPGHVPLPVRRGTARRAPAGLHRHGCVRPLPAHARGQRVAHDGLRRVRAARRAVRGADRSAPRDDDLREHRGVQAAAAAAGPGARPAPRAGDYGHRLLPLDAVDLPADLRFVVRQRQGPRPAHHRADLRAGQRSAPARGRHEPVRRCLVRAGRAAAAHRHRQPPARVPRGVRGELVSGTWHGAGQRGGYRRRAQRAGQLPGGPQAAGAVEDAHHRLCRAAAGRPGAHRLAGQGPRHAAELDRPLDRCARKLHRPRVVGGHRRLHHPSGHAVRRDVPGNGTRARTGRRAGHRVVAGGDQPILDGGSRLAARGRRGLSAVRGRTLRPGPPDRRGEGQDRRLHRLVRGEPGVRDVDPRVRRGLRTDGLWHRRDHGGARGGRAGLGVRREVRPADRAHGAARRGFRGQGVHR